MSLLEAASFGKSIIVSPECDLARTVDNQKMGLVLNNFSELGSFIDNRNLLLSSRRNAFSWALGDCSSSNVGKLVVPIYTSLSIDNH